MSTGTLVTVKNGVIVKRAPIWPFPARDAYPRENAEGSTTYFEPRPYYNFPLGDKYARVS
jgi:hypothetical protein